MALPTNPDPYVEVVTGVATPKALAAMHLFWDEVVEGERHRPVTADTGGGFSGFHSLLVTSSISESNSGLSGPTREPKWATTSPSADTTYLLKFHFGYP